MRLAAIYNVFDGTELLAHSMRSIKSGVDVFIIVWQSESNFGEFHYPFQKNTVTMTQLNEEFNCIFVEYKPIFKRGTANETEKRNIGLDKARQLACTHFLFMDCDELYRDFNHAKNQYIDSGKSGSVNSMCTYFKKPTLRLEDYDNYYVPFIHELYDDTKAGPSKEKYPFYVDPTRQVNQTDIHQILFQPMHHFSWCRLDIGLKVRNSSAKANILMSDLVKDYQSEKLKTGYYLKDYRQKLVEVSDIFGLSKIFE